MAIVPYCYKYSHPIGNLINLFEYSISHRNVTNKVAAVKIHSRGIARACTIITVYIIVNLTQFTA
jgi:hypothetical protein